MALLHFLDAWFLVHFFGMTFTYFLDLLQLVVYPTRSCTGYWVMNDINCQLLTSTRDTIECLNYKLSFISSPTWQKLPSVVHFGGSNIPTISMIQNLKSGISSEGNDRRIFITYLHSISHFGCLTNAFQFLTFCTKN